MTKQSKKIQSTKCITDLPALLNKFSNSSLFTDFVAKIVAGVEVNITLCKGSFLLYKISKTLSKLLNSHIEQLSDIYLNYKNIKTKQE